MEAKVESDNETSDIEAGIAAVNLLGDRKSHIRAPWSYALIVKVAGKTMGYKFISNRLMSLWKPSGRMDCVALGHLRQGFCLWLFGFVFQNFLSSISNHLCCLILVRLLALC
ncbi:hypothetical protein ACB092_10G117500 [Castanea dentata]